MNYIDKNWEYIFGPNVRKKKTLVGTIAGCLSHNSPTIFTSGQEIFKEPGWWKLSQNEKPSFFQKLLQQDKKPGKKVEDEIQEPSPLTSPREIMSPKHKYIVFFKEVDSGNQCSRTIPYIAKNDSVSASPQSEDPEVDNLNTVQSSLMDFLAESFCSDGMMFNDVLSPPFDTPFDIKSPPPGCKLQKEEVEQESFQPRIVQVTNFQKIDDSSGTVGTEKLTSIDLHKNIFEEKSEEPEEDESWAVEPCEKGWFTKTPKRKYPWLEYDLDNSQIDQNASNVMINENQEEELFYKLKRIIDLEDELEITIPPKIRRFYRKLNLRRYKRKHGKQILDVDKFCPTNLDNRVIANKIDSIFDRYYDLSTNKRSINARIVCSSQVERFESPFTCRVLQPFIYRSSSLFPPWIKVSDDESC